MLGITRAPRELPRYTFSLGYEGSLPQWQSTWGFQWQHRAAVRTEVPGEVQARTRSRNTLDAHFVRRLTPALNLRLSAQNLLGEGSWRSATSSQGGQPWALTSREEGQRTAAGAGRQVVKAVPNRPATHTVAYRRDLTWQNNPTSSIPCPGR